MYRRYGAAEASQLLPKEASSSATMSYHEYIDDLTSLLQQRYAIDETTDTGPAILYRLPPDCKLRLGRISCLHTRSNTQQDPSRTRTRNSSINCYTNAF